MIKQTEQRQNISLRGESYFRLLSQAFAGNASFMFVKTDVTVYIDGLKKRLAKEPENAEKINQQIGEAEKIMAERGKIVPLAALLTVFPPNSEGPRIAEYLYAGSDLTVFSSFCATMCGVNEVCLESIKRGCHFLNLGGFAGTFDDGLYDFKRQFNPLCVEYAGEFDLVINAAKNSLMTKYLPQLKKLYKKLKGGKLNKTSKNGQ